MGLCIWRPYKLTLAGNHHVTWHIKRKNRSNGLACRRVEEPKKCSKFLTGGVYILPTWGAKTPGRIEPNFLVVGVYDVILPFKFGDDRFRGFWLAEDQSLPFPIDFEGPPYNTHTIVWGVIIASRPIQRGAFKPWYSATMIKLSRIFTVFCAPSCQRHTAKGRPTLHGLLYSVGRSLPT